jgi:hypothetical protein
MAIKTVVVQKSTTIGEKTFTDSQTYTGSSYSKRTVFVPAGSEDMEEPIAIDVSRVQNFVIRSTRDMIVEGNSGTLPDFSFTLHAGVAMVWNAKAYFDLPLTDDVTSLFLTNFSGYDAEVEIEVLMSS